MSHSRIGIVTGANKGIGLAIVRQLALQYPRSPLNNGPLLIYLTARNKDRGEAAIKSLEQDAQLREAKAVKAHGGLSEIVFHALDIEDKNSMKAFTEDLKQAHGGEHSIDFVINNAAIVFDGYDVDIVKKTLDCNYYSTMAACHALLPLLKPDGRITNVASLGGALSKYSSAMRDRFLASVTEDDVTSIMKDFQATVEEGREKEAGFPRAAYAVSKAGLIGGTRALAKQVQGMGLNVLVNSCCPGYVRTDMTKGKGMKTPDEGASTPVYLTLQDIAGTTGEIWTEEKVVQW